MPRPALSKFSHLHATRRMRGIATVLILLLIGLGLTAAVFGTVAYIRGNQSQDVSSHAQAQAQAKAWTGAEIVRQYLQALQDAGKMTALLTKTPPFALTLQGNGITGLVTANVVSVNTTDQSLVVNITGLTAAGSRAEASSTLAVVYGIGTGAGTGSGGSSSGAAGTCGSQPKASTVFRGSVNISGGQSAFVSGENFADIAVDGSLTIANASQAILSGCTKGDINMSGGGIDANATLSSQNGTITITNMSAPSNATIWGKNITIDQFNGNYAAVKAGSYAVSVRHPTTNVALGSAEAGGKLLAGTTGTTIPWATGTVVPWNTGSLLITLTDNTQYLVKMSAVTINATTGVVTGAQAAASLITGSTAMPDSFKLVSTSISGGNATIVPQTKVGQLWGYGVTISGSSSGDYTQVWPAGDFKVGTGTIGTLIGGSYMQATAGGCSSTTNCWNFPTINNASTIAGSVSYGGGSGTAFTGTRPNLTTNQASSSPGLPGAPFCDTRAPTIDVTDFKSQANYVFFFDSSGNPKLTIQNVKNAAGVSIDRTNVDLKTIDPAPATLPANFQLRQIGGKDFIACSYAQANAKDNDALSCFRSATTSGGWDLTGITKFPPGIAWFQGPVKINGVSISAITSNPNTTASDTLYNAILATGAIDLTSAGHGPLIAPNLSTVNAVCDGNFYPSNLCNKTTTPTTLATWTDSAGVTHSGLPIGNVAIMSNSSMTSSGWTITGSVILGGALNTSGALTTINGALTVGSNASSNTNITAGGIKVDTSKLTSDQAVQPGTSCATATPAQPIKMRWARYL